MGTSHVYQQDPKESTEWEDILVRKGILAPRETEEDDLEGEEELIHEEAQMKGVDDGTLDELDELEVFSLLFFGEDYMFTGRLPG
jgi:hypothetical protein